MIYDLLQDFINKFEVYANKILYSDQEIFKFRLAGQGFVTFDVTDNKNLPPLFGTLRILSSEYEPQVHKNLATGSLLVSYGLYSISVDFYSDSIEKKIVGEEIEIVNNSRELLRKLQMLFYNFINQYKYSTYLEIYNYQTSVLFSQERQENNRVLHRLTLSPIFRVKETLELEERLEDIDCIEIKLEEV